MSEYDSAIALAQRMIKKKGRVVQFFKKNTTLIDPLKPWNGTTGDETPVDISGVFVPPNTVRQFGLTALGEGTEYRDLVTLSEKIIIIYPGEYDLTTFVSVLDRTTRWGIVGLQVLRPGDEQILAYVGVRR